MKKLTFPFYKTYILIDTHKKKNKNFMILVFMKQTRSVIRGNVKFNNIY